MPDRAAKPAAEHAAQKTVLVGVTGCIAAYKACEIVRGLQKAGVHVKVAMTEHATQFVGPATFRALTREPVAVGLFDAAADPIHHISLAQEADVMLLAPCTANVAAKVACGIADDLLTTTVLAATCPVVVAPAMNVNMYRNAATRRNLDTLRARGMRVVDAGTGYLACGEEGEGRLADVETIVGAVLDELCGQTGAEEGANGGVGGARLDGRRLLVTAGPTQEPIDPVRFLSNRSSGKMGYAVARAAARRGAQVTLVSGPVALDAPCGVDVVAVQTAEEMLAACRTAWKGADAGVFTAAVCDMRPATRSPRKLKKGADAEALARIELAENPDVAATLAADKGDRAVVAFAAETDDLLENARAKLAAKHADLVVANDVGGGAVFGADENRAWLVDAQGEEELPPLSKDALADRILDRVAVLL